MKEVVIIKSDKCIACERCLASCPADALQIKDGVAIVDPERCTACGECVKVCPADAMSLSGEVVQAAAEKVSADKAAPSPEAAEVKSEAPSEKAGEVWVFVEQTEGKAATVSWELLGIGRQLSNDINGNLAAVVLGKDVRHLADEAFTYGADKVYLVESPVLNWYRTEPYLLVFNNLVGKYKPEILLLGATTMGRDLAGAVATTLRTGLTADCTSLTIDPTSKLLEQTRPAYGGNIMATILCEERRPQMSTVRPRVMPMPEKHPGRSGRLIEEKITLVEEEVPSRVIEYHREETNEIRIEDSEIIVAGGRGLGSPAGFKMLQELADVLGGVVGASRGAVDSGWISAAHQVGQTGKTVRPKLYFACGISGAIQHLVGMQTADVIVAVNSDPHAPIFKVATYGIVGDIFKIIPALTEEFRAKLKNRGSKESAVS